MKQAFRGDGSAFKVAGAAFVSACLSGVAIAQEAALEEIVVTATRRNTTIQDTPINIAAVTGAQIAREGLDTLSEALRGVPGVNVIDQGSRGGSQIVVRGLNAEPLVNNDNSNDGGGTVATYVSETPLFAELRLQDMERVEVLLGPQGTLYGAGTLGGAIRYIPRQPKFDDTSVEIRGNTYRYSEADSQSFDAGVTVNLPVTDQFALRASVDRLDDSGFIDQPYVLRDPGTSLSSAFGSPEAIEENFKREKDVNYEETWAGRVAARWAPSEKVDLNLTYYFQFQDVGGRQSSSRRVDSMPVTFGEYQSALRVLEPSDRDNQLLALEATFDLGFAELTSATAYSEYDQRSQRDQTDLAIELGFGYELFPALVVYTDEKITEERFNQEFRLVSKGDGPLSWTAGAFYNDFERRVDYTEFAPGLHEFFNYAVGDDRDYLSIDKSERSEYAFYGEVSYAVTDAWTFTAGARYYSYDLDIASAATFPPFPPTGPEFNFNDAGQSDDGFLGKLNASYRFSPDALAYLTFSQGYRSGGSNALTPCPVPYTSRRVRLRPAERAALYARHHEQLRAGPKKPVARRTAGVQHRRFLYRLARRATWVLDRCRRSRHHGQWRGSVQPRCRARPRRTAHGRTEPPGELHLHRRSAGRAVARPHPHDRAARFLDRLHRR